MLKNDQKQYLREATLKYMSERPTMGLELGPLYTFMRKKPAVDFEFSESDLAEALAVLVGLGFVSQRKPRLGSVPVYQATAEGVIFHEQSAT